METSAPRPHRLVWLAAAAFGALLLLPATRHLLRMDVQFESLTFASQLDLAAERAAASHLSNDYPVQLALATEAPTAYSDAPPPDVDPMAQSKARNRRILALTERFPNNPSVYANLLRYMSLGEMHVSRDEDLLFSGQKILPPSPNVIRHYSSPESLAMFDAVAEKGEQLDPDNAYFPMLRAAGLFAAHRDSEALESLKKAGACSKWTEYFQDDVAGQNQLQQEAYGNRGAIPRFSNTANLLLPHYTELRKTARIAMYLEAEEERAGRNEEGIAIRHALMRCGGLMRSQGRSLITCFVGIAISNIATANPGGLLTPKSNNDPDLSEKEQAQQRQEQLSHYCAFLDSLGNRQEAAWAKAELEAGATAKQIGKEGLSHSIFDCSALYQLSISRMVNLALLSSTFVLLILGAAAGLASQVRGTKWLTARRIAYALLVCGGIGLWQWKVAGTGMKPLTDCQALLYGLTTHGQADNANAVQCLTTFAALLLPALFVGILGIFTLTQRVPLATGLGRALRGISVPIASALFLLYSGSLLCTAHLESTLLTGLDRTIQNESGYIAEMAGKTWPGDPKP